MLVMNCDEKNSVGLFCGREDDDDVCASVSGGVIVAWVAR